MNLNPGEEEEVRSDVSSWILMQPVIFVCSVVCMESVCVVR